MTLTLQEIRKETERVFTLIFSSDAPFIYRAGQHISMRLPHENPDNRGTIRSFSLSSSPTEDYLSITTNQGVSSFKKKLFSLSDGDTIEARGPGGGFILRQEDPGHHLMIAGGIGITPFRSMLKYAFDKQLSRPMTLLYSCKTSEEIIFHEELDGFAQAIPSLRVIYTITRPEAERTTWSGKTGRIDAAFLREVSTTGAQYYICGPILFVDAMISLVGSLGVPSDRVRFERFTGYTE